MLGVACGAGARAAAAASRLSHWLAVAPLMRPACDTSTYDISSGSCAPAPPPPPNAEADTSLNQAGMWAHGSRNHFVGNRFANSFNGLFIQNNFAGGDGRGSASGELCVEHEEFGTVRGNTNHGHKRFGTYILGPSFPRAIEQTISSNGLTNLDTCDAFTSDGEERGVAQRGRGRRCGGERRGSSRRERRARGDRAAYAHVVGRVPKRFTRAQGVIAIAVARKAGCKSLCAFSSTLLVAQAKRASRATRAAAARVGY